MPSPKVQGRRGVAPKKKTKAAARNRPGRPEGSNGQVRDRILDASELLFAERGYAGTTLREVADAAEVTQAIDGYLSHLDLADDKRRRLRARAAHRYRGGASVSAV